MKRSEVKEKVGSLDDGDLSVFYANLATGHVPPEEYRRRLPIIRDIMKVVEAEADKREIDLPCGENAYHLKLDSGLSSDENLEDFLGTDWERLVRSYHPQDN